jgi:hypothetical protein
MINNGKSSPIQSERKKSKQENRGNSLKPGLLMIRKISFNRSVILEEEDKQGSDMEIKYKQKTSFKKGKEKLKISIDASPNDKPSSRANKFTSDKFISRSTNSVVIPKNHLNAVRQVNHTQSPINKRINSVQNSDVKKKKGKKKKGKGKKGKKKFKIYFEEKVKKELVSNEIKNFTQSLEIPTLIKDENAFLGNNFATIKKETNTNRTKSKSPSMRNKVNFESYIQTRVRENEEANERYSNVRKSFKEKRLHYFNKEKFYYVIFLYKISM